MRLRDYQQEGAEWLSQRTHAGLFDPPGLGKTAQAIEAARRAGARPTHVVVVCPAVACTNWRREFAAWWPEAAPYVISYDGLRLRHNTPATRLADIDALILDEAHYLKNKASARTLQVYRPSNPAKGVAAQAKRVWALTGTPKPNHVGELWTHFRALRPDLIAAPAADRPMSETEFLIRYTRWTGGPYGPKIHGLRNEEELRSRLGQLALRRKIADVLGELPPIDWGRITVDPEDAADAVMALEDSPDVERLRARLETDGDFREEAIHLSTLRRLTGLAKARAVGQLVANELRNKAYEQVVIFAQHTAVIDRVARELEQWNPVRVTGSVPPARRQAAIDDFQAGRAKVFLGQLQAASTAITLTAAHHVVFVECSWVPDENLQAAKRCHRFGQNRPVFVRVAGLAGSIDDAVAGVITRKLRSNLED